MRSSSDWNPDRNRLFLGFISLLFLTLVFRLFQLQILQKERYRLLAERNRVKVVYLPALRGEILDRNGKIMADSRPGYSVFIDPGEMTERTRRPVLVSLSRILEMEPEEIEEKLSMERPNPLDPLKLKRNVGFEIVSQLEEQRTSLPGVTVKALPIRRYRHGEGTCHLTGYVGDLTKDELGKLYSKGYKYGDMVGKMGLERRYEDYLRGKDGVEYLEVDALGMELGAFPERSPLPASPGDDLVLTIDLELQLKADSLLAGRGRGAIVALDPRNGEILALASRPSFDPNLLAAGIDPEVWHKLRDDPASPLWNRATRAAYPPGSVFKLFAAASALDRELVTQSSHLDACRGRIFIGRRYFTCWKTHGRLNLHEAIVQSCDTYFYQLGMKIGLDALSKDALSYGFGARVGIDLPPESPGLVPTREWYETNVRKGRWGAGVAANLAIGQGEMLATPLQLCSFMGAVAANGVLYRPHLMKRIVNSDGRVIEEHRTERTNLPISSHTLKIMREAMWGVVNEEEGTGTLARISGVGVAGKTGTAENPQGEDHAWFCGFAPYEDPQICVACLIENAGHGGTLAAPVVRELIESYLQGSDSR